MLNRTLITSVFRSQKFAITASSNLDASTRRFKFDNIKQVNHKYKAAAKERRRVMRNKKADENKLPNEMGEIQPAFMIPARYKLILKYIQTFKNQHRLARKPIPIENKQQFAQTAKDYALWIQAQRLIMEKEEEALILQQFNTEVACYFLPEYL